MNKLTKFMQKYKEFSKIKKLLVYFLLLIIAGVIFITLAYLVGSCFKAFYTVTGHNSNSELYYGLFDETGRIFTIVAFAAFLIMMIIAIIRTNHKNEVKSYDERGIGYLENGTNGTARFMNEKEAEKAYEITNIANTTTTIYGQLKSSEKGEKVVGYKGEFSDELRNNLIIGSPGTGKSRCFVKNEIIQTVLRKESFVCTDPKGELYGDTAQFCRDNGLNVKVLNLIDPTYSNYWDCLKETLNPATERLNEQRLKDFWNVYMKNADVDSNTKAEEKFWFDSAKNILITITAYLAFIKEDYIVEKYKEIYIKVCLDATEEDELIIKNISKKGFPWSRKQILTKAKENNFSVNEIKGLLVEIHKNAPKYNIDEVYKAVLDFENTDKKIEGLIGKDISHPNNTVPFSHPLSKHYKIYKTNIKSDTVKSSAVQGAQMKMDVLSDEKIRQILSRDDIKLGNSNKVETAYYVMMSDRSNTYKPVASLFFTFLFMDAQEEFDKAQQISAEKGEINKRLPINFILDEFFSIGVIGGSPDSFAITTSTSRSRKFRISIILQAYPQLQALYGEECGKTIQNNCDTFIFLGCNEQETAEFVSTFIAGQATVLTERHRETGNIYMNAGNEVQIQSTARLLLTPDEVRRWHGEVLVAKRGYQPLRLKPFPYVYNPAYLNGKLKNTTVYTTIDNLDDLLEKEEEQEALEQIAREKNDTSNDAKTIIRDKIDNLKPREKGE